MNRKLVHGLVVILFCFVRVTSAADVAQKPAATDAAKIPAGYTCAEGLKVVRVIGLRQITSNRLTDKGKFEPLMAKMSADGSKIAFTCPGGLFAINADGTERSQVLEQDNTAKMIFGSCNMFELTADGKSIFWQSARSPLTLFKIDADGKNETTLLPEGSHQPLRFRMGGKRIFFGKAAGIYSIDAAGEGDFKEIITAERLGAVFDVPRIDLAEFDVSEDGTRLAISVFHPKAKKKQLCAIKGNGTEFRQIAKSDFEPVNLSLSPDGSLVVCAKWPGVATYTVSWDGGELKPLAVPPYVYDGQTLDSHIPRFSANGEWFAIGMGNAGSQVLKPDGSERWEPVTSGLHDFVEGVFMGGPSVQYTPDLRKFCYVNNRWWGAKPRQIVVGEVNPANVEGLPVISDIEFTRKVSTNPQVGNHRGKLKVKVKAGTGDIQRVQYLLTPCTQKVSDEPEKWDAGRGMVAMHAGRFDSALNDEGKEGDAAAGDGVFTSTKFGPASGPDWKPAPGHYVLRIVAHDEKGAVLVDVDGIDIK